MMMLNLSKFALAAAIAIFGLTATGNSALAGKEVFERSKPHVNVGSIGKIRTQSGGQTNAGMLLPAVQATRSYTPPPPPQPPSSTSQDDCMSCD
jgi:hypothetical protein